MIATFHIGQGETLPYYKFSVRDVDGLRSLSDVTAVYFTMARLSTGSVAVSAPAVVTDELAGEGEYRWSIADTQATGSFAAELLFVMAAGGTFTLPRNETAKVVVEPRYPSESE